MAWPSCSITSWPRSSTRIWRPSPIGSRPGQAELDAEVRELDDRAKELDRRERALSLREADLGEREKQVAVRERKVAVAEYDVAQQPRMITKTDLASTRVKKLGRNELCWCRSGKKYKHCHLSTDD